MKKETSPFLKKSSGGKPPTRKEIKKGGLGGRGANALGGGLSALIGTPPKSVPSEIIGVGASIATPASAPAGAAATGGGTAATRLSISEGAVLGGGVPMSAFSPPPSATAPRAPSPPFLISLRVGGLPPDDFFRKGLVSFFISSPSTNYQLLTVP